MQIFNKLLRREISNRMPTVDHIAQNKPEILTQLCYGCVGAGGTETKGAIARAGSWRVLCCRLPAVAHFLSVILLPLTATRTAALRSARA